MSRAKQLAEETFPEHLYGNDRESLVFGFEKGYEQAEKDLADVAQFSSGPDGFFYGKGYQQAKKDLGLTWEDIERIEHYCEQVNREHNMGTFRGAPYGKTFYKEVARKFNKAKEERK